jgi:hypothetical protein
MIQTRRSKDLLFPPIPQRSPIRNLNDDNPLNQVPSRGSAKPRHTTKTSKIRDVNLIPY